MDKETQEVIAGERVWHVVCGDSALVFRDVPDHVADALIMDPPAGINFMNQAFDSDRGGMEQWVDWLAVILGEAFRMLKPGAHALVWSLPRTSYWTALALRKAGFDIRDTIDHVAGGGFPKSLDISKAIDAAAGVADQRPVIRCGESGKGSEPVSAYGKGLNVAYGQRPLTGPVTPEAARWAGWGTALRPNKEVWWLCRKPLAKGHTVAANVLRHGVGGLNIDAARVAGGPSAGGSSAEGIGYGGGDRARTIDRSMPDGRWPSNITFQHSSWDEAECRACGVVAPFAVRFCPACGSGDVEAKRGGCRCVGERRVRGAQWTEADRSMPTGEFFSGTSRGDSPMSYADEDGFETVDAWECLATCERCGVSALVPSGGDAGRCPCGFGRRWACAVALLDEQSGSRPSGARAAGVRTGAGYSGGARGDGGPAIEASEGGASRFFHCFPPEPFEPPPLIYSAKPSTAEREAGLSGEAGHEPLPKRTAGELTGREDRAPGTKHARAGAGGGSTGRANVHPTVKGFHLIGHFCDLVVPPGGLVLDLTAGSGTLGAVVAHRHQATRWRCIMAELDPAHCKIIRERCRYWGARPWRPRTKAAAKPKVIESAEQPSLFASVVRKWAAIGPYDGLDGVIAMANTPDDALEEGRARQVRGAALPGPIRAFPCDTDLVRSVLSWRAV